jgi:hypothetical protein
MKETESNLAKFYKQINNTPDKKEAASDSANIAAGSAAVVQTIANATPSVPSISTLGAISNLTRAGNDLNNNRNAKEKLKGTYLYSTIEQQNAASYIVDKAFADSKIVPYGKDFLAKVATEKLALIYNSTLTAVITVGKDPSKIKAAIPDLTNALKDHLEESVSNESYIKKAFKRGGTNHISFKDGTIENMDHIFDKALPIEKGSIELKDDNKIKYTELSEEEALSLSSSTQKPKETYLEEHHTQTKKNRSSDSSKAAVGVVNTGVELGVAAVTHGTTSPLLVKAIIDTGLGAYDAKKNHDAVRTLSPSINNASNQQIDTADAIVEGAFQTIGLANSEKPWHERVDPVKKSEIYKGVLGTLMTHVDDNQPQIGKAIPDLTAALAEHLNFEVSHKNPFLNAAKDGGVDDHISFKTGATKNISDVLSKACYEKDGEPKFKGNSELDHGASILSRPQERKAALDDGSLKLPFVQQVSKDAGKLGKHALGEAKTYGDNVRHSGDKVENTQEDKPIMKRTFTERVLGRKDTGFEKIV